ncbi:DMT family transporter [Microbacterium marinilacus]|uniref:DMT family transporter n=1 Tax=Microbacterium marinilacus TaxID=415209 RepID=A0ABP7B1P1_9MICO|nr:DMT family transporter [Microbacterium marinilacus]MBY0690099.1 DMT family transporter [Microbacterium marinilacus]
MPDGTAEAAVRRRALGYLALVGATLSWAGNYLLGVIAVAEMDPVSLTWLRWALAVVPLFVVAQLVERPDWRSIARAWPRLLVLGGIGVAGYNLLLYAALDTETPFQLSLINAFNPALIAIAAVVFLGARLGWRGVGGILLAFVGVLWIISGGRPLSVLEHPPKIGSLIMVGAIVAWTAYTIIGRTGPRLPPISAVAAQGLIVVVGLTPFVLVQGLSLPQTAAGGWSLAYIAVFPSIVSYVLWNYALQHVPPAQAGVSLNLITVFTAIATVLLGMAVTVPQIVGGVLVLAGVVLAQERPRRSTA